MSDSRSDVLSHGNANVIAESYMSGRVDGRLMGGGGTGVEELDFIQQLGDIFLLTRDALEKQSLIQASAAAEFAYQHRRNTELINIERRLDRAGYEPLNDSERQEILRNAEAARERGRTDILDRNGAESDISDISFTESWRPAEASGSIEAEWSPERLAQLDAEINELMSRILRQLDELKDLLRSIDHIKKKTSSASMIPSPITLDLDGDGIETVSVSNGALFDHAADGFAERTGWIGKDDGLLVRDLDGNGRIDSGRELFGSETLLASGNKAANGFEALAELDGNSDGVVDANDAAFAELRVWKDANGNGRTDEGELLTLDQAGVQSISVAYTNSSHVDEQGNAHRQVGNYTTTGGETRAATDVWVQTDATYSVPTEWVNVPDEIAQLPDAQGYGKVRDLHQAMALDTTGELKALVADFTVAETPEDRDALVTRIIYRWTGVQDVDPLSRASRMIYGNAIGDARKLEALEEFMGEEWVGVWCWGTPDPNPHGRAAPVLLAAWDELKALVYGQLMAQSHLKGLFQQITYRWDEELSEVRGELAAVADTLTTSIQNDREAGLTELGDFLHSLRGMGLLNRLEVAGLKEMLLPLGADVAQTFDVALKGWVAGAPTEGDDVLRGTEIGDLFDGRGGNDRLLGRGGDDTLIGGAGDDVIDGGVGDDVLIGSSGWNWIYEDGQYRVERNTTPTISANGNDTYLFGRGDGQDTVLDGDATAGNTDTLRFKEGVALADVRFIRNGNDLVLAIRDSSDQVTLKRYFDEDWRGENGPWLIERIAFEDGTVLSFADVQSILFAGSEETAANKSRRWPDGGAANTTWRVAA